MKYLISALFFFNIICLHAEDWPTSQHDNQRSGITAEQLNASNLTVSWVFSKTFKPQPAWIGKMKRDSYAKLTFQGDSYDYDKSFNLIVADNKVFFASSAENACVALNASNGNVIWKAPAISPVRVAPTYDSGKVYFGSDDGWVYCVNASNGSSEWKYRGAPDPTLIGFNHKFISRVPCRTGVLIQNGKAYCGFGLMSWNHNYMVQLNASNGSELIKKTIDAAGCSFEGCLLSDGTNLFVTQGRFAPYSFSLSNLAPRGKLRGCGGTFATISPDKSYIFYGPGHINTRRKDHMQKSKTSDLSSVAQLDYVSRILIDSNNNQYAILRDAVTATGSVSWTQGIDTPVTLILGGNTLFVGAKNKIFAIDVSSGNVLKILNVDGTAYCLAIANNTLFASTTSGKIYAFH